MPSRVEEDGKALFIEIFPKIRASLQDSIELPRPEDFKDPRIKRAIEEAWSMSESQYSTTKTTFADDLWQDNDWHFKELVKSQSVASGSTSRKADTLRAPLMKSDMRSPGSIPRYLNMLDRHQHL